MPESAATATAGALPAAPLPRGALRLLRWLPTQAPSGAFVGQHDQVHCPTPELHTRVNLWWSDGVVHPGDHVGPPRGGLVPGRQPSYGVALPPGGYLLIEAGVLVGWRAQLPGGLTLVRADGESFDDVCITRGKPYFRSDYQHLTPDAVRAALAAGGSEQIDDSSVRRVLQTIAAASDPVVCGCTGRPRTAAQSPLSLVVPESLLTDSGTLRVLLGAADAAESAATLWRLSAMIWDPAQVGRAMAAEAVARNSGEPARGWPQAPVTEPAVAHIAAQAVRHHGGSVVRAMPAWLLGWVMIAAPVLATGQPSSSVIATALEVADRVREARVETQWHTAAAARTLISRSCAALRQTDDPVSMMSATASIDLRRPAAIRPDHSNEEVAGFTLREASRLAYQRDVRTWLALLAQGR